jgi:hypothetical protein
MKNGKEIEWCNWTFEACLVKDRKWIVKRDCSPEITLNRGDSRNYRAYHTSLQPTYQGAPPPVGSNCPNCHKYVNGVNLNDDGETWRM